MNRKRVVVVAAGKPAVGILNELSSSVQYEFEERDGGFRCTVEVDGVEFTGTGPSKRSAKNDAAEKALSTKSYKEIHSTTKNSEKIIRKLKNIPQIEENTCSALNTLLFPNTVNYELVGEEGPPHEKQFTVRVVHEGFQFIGRGGSKKKANSEAARRALVHIIGEDCFGLLVS